MSENATPVAEGRLGNLEARLQRLESLLLPCLDVPGEPTSGVDLETPVAPWRYLVLRRHPWRRQLSVQGRNMTARHLVKRSQIV